MDYEPILPTQNNPEKLQKTANKILYIVGGIGLVALIAAAVIFWIIPMTQQASGSNVDTKNGGGNSGGSSKSQYESCLRSGKSSTDCLKYLQ